MVITPIVTLICTPVVREGEFYLTPARPGCEHLGGQSTGRSIYRPAVGHTPVITFNLRVTWVHGSDLIRAEHITYTSWSQF